MRSSALRATVAVSGLIYPRTYPRGVFRFRSFEEAQAARERHNVGLADHSIFPNAD